ncbi:ABC transporter permease [Cryptosporangium arvum]|uniref:ABC transporter permease n=1 Tax=Cryptosporangium arvum TaxID=80871 RepID=UPI00056D431E|nr:ABC transporter permease [Cryptosporangium arvum]
MRTEFPPAPVVAPVAAAGAPRRTTGPLRGAAGVLIALAVWELVPRIGLVREADLPPVSSVLRVLAREAGTGAYWTAIGQTVYAWLLGLALAAVAAITLGFALALVPRVRAFTTSTVEFLRPIPSVALIPLAVLVYGTGLGSSLLLVVYAAFWQIYVQVLAGVADIDPVADETARSFRFSRWGRIRHVVWPSALPYVLTGVRLGAAVALILAVTAELVIGAPGLGLAIAVARSGTEPALVYALVLTTGVLGVLVNVGVRAGERRLLRWHASVRREVPV